jgi:hypothetical protein
MAKFKSFVFEERNIVLYSACVGEFKKQGIAARFTKSNEIFIQTQAWSFLK